MLLFYSHLSVNVGDPFHLQILNQKAGLDKTCDFVKADFMSIPAADNTYDAVYAIEATCHAPDAVSGCLSFYLQKSLT